MLKVKFKNLIFFIVILFFLNSCSSVNYKTQDQSRSKPVWPHETSDLQPDPALKFKVLSNGFKYVLMQNTTPKDRVSMHLAIQAGSFHETDEQQGAAHFLEHMLFNGSEHFKPGELVKYFQSIGMDFGPDANAHTGFFSTGYDILLPKGDEKSLADGLLVMQDYAQSALLLPDEIERERKVILAEKRSRDSSSYRTFVSTLQFELPEMRLSRRIPIGIEQTIKKADQALLKDFYDTWYRPDNMFLVMTGDFDLDTASSLIEKKFNSMTPRLPAKPEPEIGALNHKGIKTFYHYEKEAGNTDITIEVLRKKIPEPDSFAFQKKYLIQTIADQIVQNRLETMVRKPDTPFTQASIGSGIYARYIEYGTISAKSSPEKWKQTLSVLEQTLRTALEYGFTEPELERVKKDYIAGLEKAVSNASTRSSSVLARKIIDSINSDKVFQSPAQEKDIYEPVINSLTLAQVHNALKEAWSPEHRLIIITGNAQIKEQDKTPEQTILSVFNTSRKKTVSGPDALSAVNFPYLPVTEEPGRIKEQKQINDLEIIQIDFENNIRLNLKKTDFKANEVLASLNFGLGKSGEPETKPGLAELSDAIINESGLGTLDRDELDRALTGKNTNLRFVVNQDTFSLKGYSTSSEIELLFQLMYAYIKDPGFRQDAYILTMERFAQGYQELSRTINGAMTLSGSRFLAGGDSRFGLPGYEEFKKLNLKDVQDWIAPIIKNAPLELSIAGDFDPEKAIALGARYFGTLEPRNIEHRHIQSRYPVFPKGKTLEIEVETNIPKGEVRVAYPSEDIWNINKTRRLASLAVIFSDRLREVIREKLGATYSPYAYNSPSKAYKGFGILQAVISIDPDDADIVVKEIKKIISDLSNNGVTKDEIQRAVAPALTSIKDMRQKNNYWLDTVMSGSKEHPEQIEWSRTIEKDYASITKQELTELAEQYLDNNKAAVIIIRPLKKTGEKSN
ncbi:Peptidase M16 domain-containing protein [Desulfonema limicola]|uniref:Peptidase M16 domain-containing protein n=1 Tax=Desulfonema limicola TaxID=45656 RepID=A0A975GJX8_9BACT|nr:insulinase family protein [Desulfonema limicola]QTA83910.1 Peptidase M16 domain-containing protein [Desulfonema limicola]